MREENPWSLNNIYIYMFTVLNPPGSLANKDKFKVTVRNIEKVIDFLFWSNVRAGLEVRVIRFKEKFIIEIKSNGGRKKIILFVRVR